MGIYRVNVAKCDCCKKYEVSNLKQNELLASIKDKGWKGTAQKLFCETCKTVYYGEPGKVLHVLTNDGILALLEVSNKKFTAYLYLDEIIGKDKANEDADKHLRAYLRVKGIKYLSYRGTRQRNIGNNVFPVAHYDEEDTLKNIVKRK